MPVFGDWINPLDGVITFFANRGLVGFDVTYQDLDPTAVVEEIQKRGIETTDLVTIDNGFRFFVPRKYGQETEIILKKIINGEIKTGTGFWSLLKTIGFFALLFWAISKYGYLIWSDDPEINVARAIAIFYSLPLFFIVRLIRGKTPRISLSQWIRMLFFVVLFGIALYYTVDVGLLFDFGFLYH